MIMRTQNFRYELGVWSDSRKAQSLGIRFKSVVRDKTGRFANGANLDGGLRLGKKFQLFFGTDINDEKNNRGFAGFRNTLDTIIFARRNIKTIENSISAAFTFNNKAGASLRVRHYWSGAIYKEFFRLNEDGSLDPDPSYKGNHDENYKLFNIDLLLRWVFAPGSELTLSWKNSVFDNQSVGLKSYTENPGSILRSDQSNSFSLKVLYYIDYNNIRKN